jgi:hypothetical protein
VAGGGVEIDEPLLPRLQHGDRGERLGDGGDPKDRVLGHGCVRRDVRDAVAVEPLQRPVADHPHRQAGRRPAVEDLMDPGLHLELVIDATRTIGPSS